MMTAEQHADTIGHDPLADFLYNRRAQLRLTLRELAERTRSYDPDGLGLSRTYLNNLERGLRGNPTPASIDMIAQALRVPAAVLYRLAIGQDAADPLSRNQPLRELFERMDKLPPSSQADILPLIEAMIARREEMDGLARP